MTRIKKELNFTLYEPETIVQLMKQYPNIQYIDFENIGGDYDAQIFKMTTREDVGEWRIRKCYSSDHLGGLLNPSSLESESKIRIED
jgi:hypothetical protein